MKNRMSVEDRQASIREAPELDSADSFAEYLDAYRSLALEELESLLSEWETGIFRQAPVPGEAYKQIREYAEGGKKFRGALVLLGYELASGDSAGRIIRSSLAYELIHAAFLIHDDVMDRSLTRRHADTAHVAFEKLGRKIGREAPEQYGISMAINAGDIGPAIAYNVVCAEALPPNRILDGMVCLNQIIIETVLGQFLDVTLSITDEPDEESVLEIHRLKTANYTVTGALRLGASLGGANETAAGRELLRRLADFGDPVGIAFQIQDDHLGMFATEGELGKDVSSDLQEQKNTLLFLHTLRHGTSKHRSELTSALGTKAEGVALERVQVALKESGAADYSEAKARQLVSEGKAVIPSLTGDGRLAKLLRELADFVIARGF